VLFLCGGYEFDEVVVNIVVAQQKRSRCCVAYGGDGCRCYGDALEFVEVGVDCIGEHCFDYVFV